MGKQAEGIVFAHYVHGQSPSSLSLIAFGEQGAQAAQDTSKPAQWDVLQADKLPQLQGTASVFAWHAVLQAGPIALSQALPVLLLKHEAPLPARSTNSYKWLQVEPGSGIGNTSRMTTLSRPVGADNTAHIRDCKSLRQFSSKNIRLCHLAHLQESVQVQRLMADCFAAHVSASA